MASQEEQMGENVLSVSVTDRDIPVVPSHVTYESVGFHGTVFTMPLPHYQPEDDE